MINLKIDKRFDCCHYLYNLNVTVVYVGYPNFATILNRYKSKPRTSKLFTVAKTVVKCHKECSLLNIVHSSLSSCHHLSCGTLPGGGEQNSCYNRKSLGVHPVVCLNIRTQIKTPFFEQLDQIKIKTLEIKFLRSRRLPA